MRQMPRGIRQDIERHLAVDVDSFTTVGGGCINNGGRLRTSRGDLFLKWNDADRYPGMFEAEAKGLALLADTKAIRIPSVIRTGVADHHQYLLLEFIDASHRAANFWEQFGVGLAAMHRTTREYAGLDHPNYIGSLPQDNERSESWIDFFRDRRLDPQLRLAVREGKLRSSAATLFEKLYVRLPDLIPREQVSLLHGDLWGGNVMADDAGLPCLIDPAVYFGHREVDIAMTCLFGGFDPRWLDSYHEAFPLTSGYHERLELYNLYPLLVHVNLFGGGYVSQVEDALRRFI